MNHFIPHSPVRPFIHSMKHHSSCTPSHTLTHNSLLTILFFSPLFRDKIQCWLGVPQIKYCFMIYAYVSRSWFWYWDLSAITFLLIDLKYFRWKKRRRQYIRTRKKRQKKKTSFIKCTQMFLMAQNFVIILSGSDVWVVCGFFTFHIFWIWRQILTLNSGNILKKERKHRMTWSGIKLCIIFRYWNERKKKNTQHEKNLNRGDIKCYEINKKKRG